MNPVNASRFDCQILLVWCLYSRFGKHWGKVLRYTRVAQHIIVSVGTAKKKYWHHQASRQARNLGCCFSLNTVWRIETNIGYAVCWTVQSTLANIQLGWIYTLCFSLLLIRNTYNGSTNNGSTMGQRRLLSLLWVCIISCLAIEDAEMFLRVKRCFFENQVVEGSAGIVRDARASFTQIVLELLIQHK